MPPLTIAAFAHALEACSSLDDAVRTLRTQLDEVSRGLELAIFRYDARRHVVVERIRDVGGTLVREPLELSLDHLPPKLRRELMSGGGLVDFGEQSADYLRFFGFDGTTDAFLLLQAIHFEGHLWALIGVREPRHRFGGRAAERISAPVGVFVLAAAQLAQRAARSQAEEALETLMSRVHEEYSRALAELRTALTQAQAQLTTTGAAAHIAELERAARESAEQTRHAFARLAAVEQQVGAAVAQLEKVHLDLSRQTEIVRTQNGLLRRLEELALDGGGAGQDASRVLDAMRRELAAGVQH